MARLFSLASWNVEHFKGDPTRVRRVVDYLKGLEPDVFALLEVEGKAGSPQIPPRPTTLSPRAPDLQRGLSLKAKGEQGLAKSAPGRNPEWVPHPRQPPARG